VLARAAARVAEKWATLHFSTGVRAGGSMLMRYSHEQQHSVACFLPVAFTGTFQLRNGLTPP